MWRAQQNVNDEVSDVGESVEHVQQVWAELETRHKQLQRFSGNGSILHGREGGQVDRWTGGQVLRERGEEEVGR